MERFWTLQYLQQNGITELVCSLFRENLVRAETLPLVLPVVGAQDLPRGARVRVRLGAIDPITLDIMGTVVERLDQAVRGNRCRRGGEEDDDDPWPARLPLPWTWPTTEAVTSGR
jgi:exoribonuclease-2